MRLTQTHAVLGKFAEELTFMQIRVDELEAENAQLAAQLAEIKSKGAEHPVKTDKKDH